LGIDTDPRLTLSPSLQEKVTYLGTVLSSFPEASRASQALLEKLLGIKRIERQTERIGEERVAERDAAVTAWKQRPLVEKDRAPVGVKAPELAAVMPDGGRLQLNEVNADQSSHWHEYKAGCLLELESEVHPSDPCPELPEVFLQRERMDKLTREIGKKAADVCDATASEFAAAVEEPASSPNASSVPTASMGDDERPSSSLEPPTVVCRDVVASHQSSDVFGPILASRSWELGFFGACRKAYVGDGSSWIWTLFKRHFQPYGFVGILDFIHALTYVYAAAMAARMMAEGWPVYVRWITWVWQGEVSKVIVELAQRQQQLGLPMKDDGPTHPRTIVSGALTYLQNQQSRMNYPEYRRQGLPITSSHIESTNKLLNHRVKGTEKFWSSRGAEAMLQLKADTLSDTAPLDVFWRNRSNRMTGQRVYTGSKT
jgi:hypothetical protein